MNDLFTHLKQVAKDDVRESFEPVVAVFKWVRRDFTGRK